MENKIKIVYKENMEFKYSNGAFGSVNQNGDFTINFFVDRPKNAESVTLRTDNSSGQIVQVFEGDTVIREVHSQIIMNVNTAKSVAQWILDNVNWLNENTNPIKKV